MPTLVSPGKASTTAATVVSPCNLFMIILQRHFRRVWMNASKTCSSNKKMQVSGQDVLIFHNFHSWKMSQQQYSLGDGQWAKCLTRRPLPVRPSEIFDWIFRLRKSEWTFAIDKALEAFHQSKYTRLLFSWFASSNMIVLVAPHHHLYSFSKSTTPSPEISNIIDQHLEEQCWKGWFIMEGIPWQGSSVWYANGRWMK